MNLLTAQRYAEQILPWLAPFCERIETVGSIRRRSPICNDVDIVCIPKLSSETVQIDMFHTEQKVTNLLREFLVAYVARDNRTHWLGRSAGPSPQGRGQGEGERTVRPEGTVQPDQPGPEPKPDAQNFLLQGAKCQLDIFCATAKTWATLQLCRTGSREHNIWLCERAKTFGLHWNPYRGLDRNGDLLDTPTEETIYAALGLPFIIPEYRELNHLRHI